MMRAAGGCRLHVGKKGQMPTRSLSDGAHRRGRGGSRPAGRVSISVSGQQQKIKTSTSKLEGANSPEQTGAPRECAATEFPLPTRAAVSWRGRRRREGHSPSGRPRLMEGAYPYGAPIWSRSVRAVAAPLSSSADPTLRPSPNPT